MNKQSFPSKSYFTKNPESIQVYDRAIEPRTLLFQANTDLTNHATDWFHLYYDAAANYAPKLVPPEPYALTGISLCPCTNPADNSPILAISGLYRYRHQPQGQLSLVHTNPIALGIETHQGHEAYLSYRDAFDPDETPRPLNETLSIDVAKLMVRYYRRQLLKGSAPAM